ncbi:hypothetical protein XBJ2_440085 [Xenorhabdus bovienii str. Jollieti]|uniref:Tail fiber protein n=1 Tax=Xenorhabdus bovienii (strain SS-2004) TaxID=406818 RepID=D3UZS4_XENBS|nr:phage tail protein [Xenorhabdus bovienii]CBJ80157.1 hypothetical protein XBJ1_1016 [Xenorhabdus bovienii SS-2004]CDH29868.1 hypothetical protein XBJ2_440085 [Xenorhabdus bovienii str. Jollieti]
MSSVITTDFEKWKAQQTAAGNPVVLDEFVFAYVPDLDPAQAINRDEKLPADNHIVHRQAVNKTGLASENAVAYSVTLGTEVGSFDFNWIGLLNSASGVIGMITHAPTQKKIKTANGLQGNVLTRSFLLEFEGAAKETAITTTAETWQIDFTARLTGIDEMQRLINIDSYGEAAFFGDGFAVVRHGEQYLVKKGLAYVGGLRGMLEFDQTLNSQRNTRVYADFSYQGNLVSQWKTAGQITVANELQNYIDAAGYPHYVFAVANIDNNGDISDLRPKGTLSDRDLAELDEELGKVKQDYAPKKWVAGSFARGDESSVVIKGSYPRVNFMQSNINSDYLAFEADFNSDTRDLYMYRRDAQGDNIYVLGFPKKMGMLATLDDINSGLADTKELAENAAPREWVAEGFARGNDSSVVIQGNYPRVNFMQSNSNSDYLAFEAAFNSDTRDLYLYRRNAQGDNIYVLGFPKKTGMLATLDDISDGLAGTKQVADNAAPKLWVANNFARGSDSTVVIKGGYPRVNFMQPNSNSDYLAFEADFNNDTPDLYLYQRNARGDNIYVLGFPQETGTLARLEDITKSSALKSNDGWWECGDTGMIVQFGTVSVGDNEVVTEKFPVTFPNKCTSLVVTARSESRNGGADVLSAYGVAISQSHMRVSISTNFSAAIAGVSFIAIGY